ncbi:lytic murein transglycosylase [Streptomyces sp. NPDC059637]|uniref:lytic murein transglycosylase n=1 Tax=Streptomyces sp. NPDC059637 TaxID=3347752 RepID=UPI0036C45B06
MAPRFGRRMGRGVAGTAIAAAAMAALTASQAPGLASAQPASSTPDLPPSGASDGGGDSSYYTDLPPLTVPDSPAAGIPGSVNSGGIPTTVLAAYQRAETAIEGSVPECGLPWQLLAGIGQVESNHARGGKVDVHGTTVDPIRGPQLNGEGFAEIRDTDDGEYDGDTTHDRAVGPMQFIPSTWATWGADGNGDGRRDPNNVFDAALAAGLYLCADDRDLDDDAQLDRAVLSYNHSREYLRTVRSWYEYYLTGSHETPDTAGDGYAPGDWAAPAAPVVPAPTSGSKPGKGTGGSGEDSGRPGKDSGGKGKPGSRPSDRETTPAEEDTATPRPTPSPSKKPGRPTPTPTETGGQTPDPSPSCPAETPTATPSGTPTATPTATPSGTPTTPPAPTPSESTTPAPTPPGDGEDEDPCAAPAPGDGAGEDTGEDGGTDGTDAADGGTPDGGTPDGTAGAAADDAVLRRETA